jgi:hypothetical protein
VQTHERLPVSNMFMFSNYGCSCTPPSFGTFASLKPLFFYRKRILS